MAIFTLSICNPRPDGLHFRYVYRLARGPTTSTTSQDHDRAVRSLDVGDCVPNIGDFAVAAYSTGRFGAVFHFLLYSTNNTALIAGIVVAGFLDRRSGAPPK